LILAARHYVAFGKASRALEILPSDPSELIESGLYFEVRGRAQFNLGSLEEAKENLKKAEEVYEKQNQSLGLARVFNMKASLLKKQNDFPRAEEALHLSIQKAEEGGDFYVQGLSQMNLALSYQEQGDYDRAIASFEEASHSAEKARHPLLTARLIQNRVNLFFSMGRAAEAEKNCYELLKLALKNHYTELQASALNFLALIASQRNQKDLELHYLNQAVSLLRAGELWFLYIQTLINRAFYYWEQKRFTPAELDAEYGLSLAKTRKIPLLTAWSQLLLGRILRDRPRPNLIQAEEYLARAHQGIWKIKNQPLYWELEFDRGLLAKKKGEWEKARGFFKSAEAMLGELLLKVPDFVKQSYLRNRKMERIEAELELVSPPLKKGD
jgi:tetratricopeptide (TPR) repeat protein